MERIRSRNPIITLNNKAVENTNHVATTIYVFTEAIKSILTKEKLKFDKDIHNLLAVKSGITIGCGCAYCVALNEYRNAKLVLHRFTKEFDFYYDVLSKKDLVAYNERLEYLENSVKQKRAKKNEYKKKLCL